MIPRSKILSYALETAILFAAYAVTARLGLSFDAVSGFATLVWPPTGIAFAFLLLFGYQIWPGIFLAAFLVNYSVGAAIPAALGIGIGNTLGPIAAVYLFRLFTKKSSFEVKLRDILGLIFLGGVLSTMISATIGSTSLLLSSTITLSAYRATWTAWWIGDALGLLIVGPLILTWFENWRIGGVSRNKKAEAWLIFISVILVSLMAFWDLLREGLHNFPASISYLVFPPLIWSALRFSPRITTTVITILAILAIFGTSLGFGPFASDIVSQGLLYLQIYIGTTTATLLILVAVVSERKKAENDLKNLNARLEDRVAARTADLQKSEAKVSEYAKKLEGMVAERTKELEEKVDDLSKLNKFMVGRELKMIELKDETRNLTGQLEDLRNKIPVKKAKPKSK